MDADASPLSTLPTLSASNVPTRRRRLWRWLAIGAGALALFAIAGFFALPEIAKSQAQKRLSALLEREVTIQAIKFNPFTLEARIQAFAIREKDNPKPLLAFDELYVDASAQSLLERGAVVSSIRLVKPSVSVIRVSQTRYNFSDILDKLGSGESSDGPPPRFAIANIELVDGTIDFDDRPEKVVHAVDAINVGIPFISNLPIHIETKVLPSFAASVNGDPFVLTGESTPFKDSHETSVKLSMKDVDLPRYLEYVPVELDFKVPSAKLAADLVARFSQQSSGAVDLIVDGTAALTELALVSKAVDSAGAKSNAELIKIASASVGIKRFDFTANKLELAAVDINAPDINIHRRADGRINLERLGPRAQPGSAPAAAPPSDQGKPFQLTIDTISLKGGVVHFADDSNASPFKTRLERIELSVNDFSLAHASAAKYAASFATDLGIAFKASGSFGVAPIASAGTVALDHARLRDYAPYYQPFLTAEITDGIGAVTGSYRLALENDQLFMALKDFEASLQSLRMLQRDKKEVVRASKLAVTGLDLDLAKQSISIASVSGAEVRALVQRAADGSINLAQLIAADPVGGKPAPSPARSTAPSKPVAPWTYAIKRVALERAAVRYEDTTTTPPIALDATPIQLTADNITSTKGARANVALRTNLNKSGSVNAKGWLTLDPASLASELALDLKSIEIVPFEPYFSPYLNLAISAGALTTQGKLAFALTPNASTKASFSGDVTVADLASTDKATSQEFLRWRSLALGQVDFTLEPLATRIGEIALADFFSRLIVTQDGRLNVQDILAKREEAKAPATSPTNENKDPPPPSPASAPTGSPDIKIGRVTVKGGTVDFSDFFIKPNYSANLTQLVGGVSELSADTAGELELRGRVNNTGTLEIGGKLNPIAKNLFLDIKAQARDIDLPAMTPYSGKYVGYGIEKGKLSVKVEYKIEDNKLTADNNVYLDQLTFGEKIESPDALKIPVLLAVALLKDRNGVIDISLPISGSIDDPQFSIGGIIVRVLVNLIVKAVTAPFALLASAFGGNSEELGYVEFDAGDAKLSAGAEAKLKTLAKALADRPGLKLDVNGRTEPASDREGLRKAKIQAQVRAQKMKVLARQGKAPASIDEVSVDPGEYTQYLTEVYRAGSFTKPRNAIGFLRDLPADEMEKLLYQHTEVSDDDVRELANRRAQISKDYLVDQGGVSAERIFIVAAKSGAEELKDQGKPTRVDFSLK